MNPTEKSELLNVANNSFQELLALLSNTDHEILERDFEPLKANAKCTTFEQGDNIRDILMHIYEWQRLQSAFVHNIRQGAPKDFIPEPYRKDYKEMDRVNFEKHKSTSLSDALKLISASHEEMMDLMGSFTHEELFNKKVFKVTYTTTMAAYFISVTVQPYSKALKRLKSHLKKHKQR